VIVVDTSALMAILLREPSAAACRAVLASADQLIMSAATLTEALVVADRRGVGDAMRVLLDGLAIGVAPLDAEAARRAALAYATWGKGVHPTGLNILDSFGYATAAGRGAPLLFVGNDFSRTDIMPAAPAPE
jgi:ribonuclease VapC